MNPLQQILFASQPLAHTSNDSLNVTALNEAKQNARTGNFVGA